MKPTLDPNIIKALSLDPASTTIANHGSSGFATTLKITTTQDGEERLYFVKTGGKDSEIMFTGMFWVFSAFSLSVARPWFNLLAAGYHSRSSWYH